MSRAGCWMLGCHFEAIPGGRFCIPHTSEMATSASPAAPAVAAPAVPWGRMPMFAEDDKATLDALHAEGEGHPAWLRSGEPVWYSPDSLRKAQYLGVVDGDPRKCGDTWVVGLSNMEASYHGGRGYVPAAALDALEPAGTTTAALQAALTEARAQLQGARDADAINRRLWQEERDALAAQVVELRRIKDIAENMAIEKATERDALAARLDGMAKALEEAEALVSAVGEEYFCDREGNGDEAGEDHLGDNDDPSDCWRCWSSRVTAVARAALASARAGEGG